MTICIFYVLRIWNVGADSLRIAQIHYDSDVHTPYLGFRETANLTAEQLTELSIQESEDTDDLGKIPYLLL